MLKSLLVDLSDVSPETKRLGCDMLGLGLVGKRGAERATPLRGPVKKPNMSKEDSDVELPPSADAAASSVGAAPKGPAAVRAGAKKAEEKADNAAVRRLALITASIAQLLLTVSRELALVKSCVVSVMLFDPSKGTLSPEVKSATTEYAKYLSGLNPEEKSAAASPHLTAWEAAADNMMHLAEVKAHLADLAAAAKEIAGDPEAPDHLNKICEAKKFILARDIKIFRIQKCWNPALVRLECMALADTSSHVAMAAIMADLKKTSAGVMKPGQAPRGKLERKIAKWLEQSQGGARQTGKRQEEDLLDILTEDGKK